MKSLLLKAEVAVIHAIVLVVKSKTLGDVILSIPQDRNASFKPKLIPKHRRMSEQIEQSIIGMYSCRTSTGDIKDQIREMYGIEISESTISTIRSRVIEMIEELQYRPLKAISRSYNTVELTHHR